MSELLFLESCAAVRWANDAVRRWSGMSAHLFWNVTLFQVRGAIGKMNITQRCEPVWISNDLYWQSQCVTRWGPRAKTKAARSKDLVCSTPPPTPFPGLSSTATTGNESRHQSLTRKWLSSPPLCTVFNYTWHAVGTHTYTYKNTPELFWFCPATQSPTVI